MSAEAAFYNNFDVIFPGEKKWYWGFLFPMFYSGKSVRIRVGKATDGRMIYFFSSFIKIWERHRDIKGHSNNKVIINFGKPKYKVNITSYYL